MCQVPEDYEQSDDSAQGLIDANLVPEFVKPIQVRHLVYHMQVSSQRKEVIPSIYF